MNTLSSGGCSDPLDFSVELKDAEKMQFDALFDKLNTSSTGLSSDTATERLNILGPNSLKEEKVNPLKQFFLYFWGPIPWMIEIAAILSALVKHWDDVIIIMALLIFNAVVGFWQEHQAASAIDALKKQLALKARLKRGGKWDEADAAGLVPGDIIRLRLGDVVPADVKLYEGDYLSVDQSAMTGESLPVTKKVGDIAYSGAIVKTR